MHTVLGLSGPIREPPLAYCGGGGAEGFWK